MRKNQKYSQLEMYKAIEHCHAEGIGYSQYCKDAGVHYATFKYWINKYHQEKSGTPTAPEAASFLPVKVSGTVPASANLIITYPNGLRIECPCSIPTKQLAILLKYR